MGVQQASLDFFNLPPEETKPPEKKAVPEKDQEDKIPAAAEAVLEAEAPAPVPDLIEIIEETPINTESNQKDGVNLPSATEEIIIDQQVRELSIVVRSNKSTAVDTIAKKSTRGRIRLSDMDNLVDLVDVPADEVLFQKRYYSIGAVSDMFKVNISLIRFWENEFDILKPKKNAKGDRLFRPEDIKNLQLIYHLLREKKYTLDGAKDFLKNNKKADETFVVIDALKKIKSFLLELKANL